MTSKDFKRKVSYYANWLHAFDLFISSGIQSFFIWKITICEVMAGYHTCFSCSPFVTQSVICDFDVDTIVVERYSRKVFEVDLRYFKSFVSSLSSFQLDVLKSDSRFTDILNFIFNEKK